MIFHLTSHTLCPYVQRAAISLHEKAIPFERTDIDLANKPDWFLKISPLGKTPVLSHGAHAIFESSAILEYLEDTQPNPLHPADPLLRAQHRGWIEFGSSVLNDIAGLYNAKDEELFTQKAETLAEKFRQLEKQLHKGPYFSGEDFTLVDAVFGPVFRYFEVFDTIGDFGIFANTPKVQAWRMALSQRPSIHAAVTAEYPALLRVFLRKRGSYLSHLMAEA